MYRLKRSVTSHLKSFLSLILLVSDVCVKNTHGSSFSLLDTLEQQKGFPADSLSLAQLCWMMMLRRCAQVLVFLILGFLMSRNLCVTPKWMVELQKQVLCQKLLLHFSM